MPRNTCQLEKHAEWHGTMKLIWELNWSSRTDIGGWLQNLTCKLFHASFGSINS